VAAPRRGGGGAAPFTVVQTVLLRPFIIHVLAITVRRDAWRRGQARGRRVMALSREKYCES